MHRRLWDTWLSHRNGTDYLFYLHTSGSAGDGIALARSTDGVRFEEHGEVIAKRPDAAWLGSGSVLERDGTYAMNFSEMRNGVQAIFGATSDDLVDWTRSDARSNPDPRWYDDSPTGRWDCINAVKTIDGAYVGYLTANPRMADADGEPARRSVGRVESDDGLHWRAAPPAVLAWGSTRPSALLRQAEVGGAEWIDGRLYLLLSTLGAYGDAGGTYVFAADDPSGPFRPRTSAFRLLSSPPPLMTYFPRFYRRAGELLVNHHSIDRTHQAWFAPMKAVCVDDGDLHLRYWHGNDRLRGRRRAPDLDEVRLVTPEPSSLATSPDHARLESGLNGVGIATSPVTLDSSRGAIIEVTVHCLPPELGHGGAGLYLETGRGAGVILVPQTHGQTLIGLVGVDDVDRHPQDLGRADTLEVGVRRGAPYRCRVLVRLGLAELYVDDRLIQCFSLDREWTGIFGFVAENADATFSEIGCWEMTV